LPLAPVAFTLRPQTFGYIFLLLTLVCLQRFRQGHENEIWLLPPLFMVWANTHGSFVFGMMVIGVAWITGLVNFRAGGLSGSELPQRQREIFDLVDLQGLSPAEVAARHGVPLILMHMRGEPRTMQVGPFARDVMKDVLQGLRRSITIARKAGVPKSRMILDPGIGFGKNFAQNYEVLQKLPQLAKLGYPLLLGTSRKSFLGATLAKNGKSAPSEERIWGTAATVTASILGGAHIVRVHDVAEMVQVARSDFGELGAPGDDDVGVCVRAVWCR